MTGGGVGQLAGLLASVCIVLGAVLGAARYIGRKVRRLADEWRAVQLSTRQASAETARLAGAIRQQVEVLVVREYEDRRRINELARWRHHHETTHGQRGGYGWTP